MVVTILLLILLLLVALWRAIKRPENFPPGPRGLPLVGYLPFLSRHHPKYPFKAMLKLSEIYGQVVGFYLGPKQAIISVCGYNAVKEALNNNDLNGRPNNELIETRTFGKKLGIMFAEGQFWQEQRSFTVDHLKEMGFVRSNIETHMFDEVLDLLGEIRRRAKSNPFGIVDFSLLFNVSVVNVLWAMVAGERFKRGDVTFHNLLLSIQSLFRVENQLRAATPIPLRILRFLPFLKQYIGLRDELFVPMQQFVLATIENHICNRLKGHPRDFIDVYLDEMDEHHSQGTTTFSKKQLASIVLDLFGAGADSTSNSIGFALLHLLRNKNVQRKIQNEMDIVCGDSLPTLDTKSRLPYTLATLMEVQRFSSIAPFTVPHCATRHTYLMGYLIPKGSLLAINLYSVLHDAAVWENPEVFLPERHLDKQGKLVKHEGFIPFGAGKRRCMADSFAKNTLFMFTAALIKSFTFEPVLNEPLPSIEPLNGFTLSYAGFKAVVKPRTNKF